MPGRNRSELTLQVSGIEELNRVARALTHIDRQLPRDFKQSVNEVARGLRDAARAAALREPSMGKGHTGLRGKVARGVAIVPLPANMANGRDGVRIITQMPEADEAIIPRGMDTVKGWRHPVFGNKSNWVVQKSGAESWFMDTMQKGEEPLRNRLIRNIDDAADYVKRSGT